MEKQRKTFLSYSRINKEFAIRLAKELKAEGFDIWLDQLDIPLGARWDREVEKALKESEIFMVIMTPSAVDSENVLDEIGFAMEKQKRILPVLLESCELPFRLRRLQYVDFTNKSFDDGVESAKDLLRSLVSQPTVPRVSLSDDERKQLAQAEEERLAKEKAESEHQAKEESDRLAAQKTDARVEAERKSKAEAKRKAKQEADRLAVQKAEEERLALAKAEADSLAKQKADEERTAKAAAERKAKEEADRLAAQRAEDERVAEAKAESEHKAKEEADLLARKKAEEERIASTKVEASRNQALAKAVPGVVPVQSASTAAMRRKPVSRGLMFAVAAIVLVCGGIGYGVLSTLGNQSSPPRVNTAAANTAVKTPTEVPDKATVATNTSIPIPERTAVPSETAVPVSSEYFTEQFDKDPKWNYFLTSGDQKKMTVTFNNSLMVFDLEDLSIYAYYLYEQNSYTDVRIEMRAENRGKNNNNVSLVCRASEAGWYEFSTEGGGVWYFYKATIPEGDLRKTIYSTIGNGGAISLKQGKAVNEYAMICKGNQITLFVNGKELSSIKDPNNTFPEGYVGFNISSLNVTPIIVDVDWFEISKP